MEAARTQFQLKSVCQVNRAAIYSTCPLPFNLQISWIPPEELFGFASLRTQEGAARVLIHLLLNATWSLGPFTHDM